MQVIALPRIPPVELRSVRRSLLGVDPAGARPWLFPLAYLAAIALAEAATTYLEPRIGLVLHATILLLLIAHVGLTWGKPGNALLITIGLAPLIRLESLSLPLNVFPTVWWYAITSVPLFLAAAISARTLAFSRRDLGLQVSIRQLPWQVAIGIAGATVGLLEYPILKPQPLAPRLTLADAWLPAAILLVCTGFLEELIFRGLIQRAALRVVGRAGILYVAVLFAVMHLGYRSGADVVLVFWAGLAFGILAAKTRTIAGVSFAHGVANVVLFLVAPFLPAIALTLPGGGLPRSVASPVVEAPRVATVQAVAVASPALPTEAPSDLRATPNPVTPEPTSLRIADAGLAASALNPTVQPTTLPPQPTPMPTVILPTATPSLPPTAIRPSPASRTRLTVTADWLNVRVGPGLTYPVARVVRQGETFEAIGRAADGKWLYVCCPISDRQPAWVSAQWVTPPASLRSLPVVSPDRRSLPSGR